MYPNSAFARVQNTFHFPNSAFLFRQDHVKAFLECIYIWPWPWNKLPRILIRASMLWISSSCSVTSHYMKRKVSLLPLCKTHLLIPTREGRQWASLRMYLYGRKWKQRLTRLICLSSFSQRRRPKGRPKGLPQRTRRCRSCVAGADRGTGAVHIFLAVSTPKPSGNSSGWPTLNSSNGDILSGDGYWLEPIPQSSQKLCAATDPASDFRWISYHCHGPEVASFVCQLRGKFFLLKEKFKLWK